MARQYETQSAAPRQYARIVGILVLLGGVLGLILGGPYLANILNIELVEDIVHLVTGALMAYVGFAAVDNSLVRSVIGILGVVYLLVTVLGFVDPNLFGLLEAGYTIYDNLLHLVLGIAGIAVGWFVNR